MEVKQWKEIYHVNRNQKGADVTILISDKCYTNSLYCIIPANEKNCCLRKRNSMIKVSIHQKRKQLQISLHLLTVSNTSQMTELEEIDNSEKFNASLSIMNRKTRNQTPEWHHNPTRHNISIEYFTHQQQIHVLQMPMDLSPG